MPVLSHQALHRRGEDSGRTFSIIFAVIALLVVMGCLIWGIILPKFRKRNVAPPPEAFATYHPSLGRPAQFPSHPALLRGFREQPKPSVRRYDPRIESPFPKRPAQQKSLEYPTNISPPHPPPALDAPGNSHGLFTPLKNRFRTRHENPHGIDKPCQLDGLPVAMPTSNDSQDYILPVPEPIALKPRPAGRPPPLTRQLERFPMPFRSNDRRGLVHPVKLFQELQRDSESTTDTFGTPCPLSIHVDRSKNTSVPSLKTVPLDKSFPLRSQSAVNTAGEINITSLSSKEEVCTCPQTRRVLSADEPGPQKTKTSHHEKQQRQLERAGTVTRPKTPVSEIRDWFDRTANGAKTENSSLKRGQTPSTNPFTTPDYVTTPPTSPELSIKTIPAPSTPVQSHRTTSRINASLSLTNGLRRTPSSAALPASEPMVTLQHLTPIKQVPRTANPSHQAVTRRSKIGRLNLVSLTRLRASKRQTQCHSLSSLSTIFKPIMAARSHHSHQASSIYSRDTKGESFLRSQMNEGFVHTIAGVEYPTRLALVGQKHGIRDHLQSKIDDWDLHTGDIDVSVFTLSALKRSLSDFGPRSTKLRDSYDVSRPKAEKRKIDEGPQAKSIPIIRVGRASDDVFGGEDDTYRCAALKVAPKMEKRGPEPILLGALGHGTAPGGAGWI